MDIQLSEFAMEVELLTMTHDLERAMAFAENLRRVEEFTLTAAPTKSNLAIAEKMIDGVNEVLGGQVLSFDKGEYMRRMHGLDAEGLKDFGSRVYRAIADLIRRIYSIIRGIFKNDAKKTEQRQKKQADALVIFDELVELSDKYIKETGLEEGKALTPEQVSAIPEGLKVAIYGESDKKTFRPITSATMANNILKAHDLRTLARQASLLTLEREVSDIIPRIRKELSVLADIANCGSNEDLFNFLRKVIAIRTERDVMDALNHLDTAGKEYHAKLAEAFKKHGVSRKYPIVIGHSDIRVSASKIKAIPVHTGKLAQSPKKMANSKITGVFSRAHLEELVVVSSDVLQLKEKFNTIVNQYNEELAAYSGENAKPIQEGDLGITQAEVAPALKEGKKRLVGIPVKIAEILRTEMDLFRHIASGLDALHADVSSDIVAITAIDAVMTDKPSS
ncbi:hypothetical protein CZP2022_175 [Vibrio phage C-ZP2022]|nr:hypothetical protein CZP2022_175 [Vibrio phage C-ZP2022]